MALVRDANGNLVDDGLGPQGRPAAPRGLAAAAATPPAIGGAGQRGAVPSYTVTSTAGGPRGTGPVITPTAQAPDGARPAAPSAAGSSFFADATRYAADAAQRVGPIAYAVPGAVGLLPALSLARSDANEQQPAATPAQPAMDPQIAAAFAARDSRRAADAAELTANADVLAQDRANLSAAVGPQFVGPEPDRDAPRPSTAPAPIAGERGNYNLANTSNVDSQGRITTRLRQPDNIIEGGYGQFGGGRAAQFLASRRNTGGGGGMSDASEEVRLRNQLTSNDPFERRAAREQMAARQALQLDAGATQRTGMQLEGEQIRASLAGEAAIQAAQATAVGKQYEAQMEGEYGLREAEIGARGTIGAARESANSGSSLKALAEADLITRRADAALKAEKAGDIAARDRLYGVAPPTRRVLTQDFKGDVIAADGYPVSEEEAAAFRRAPLPPPQ